MKQNIILTIATSATVTASVLFLFVSFYPGNSHVTHDVPSERNTLPDSEHYVDVPSVADVIEAANPAVVSVIATKDVPVYERYYEQFDPWGGFFGGLSIPRMRERGTEEREIGGGSGFFVSADGLIVTNRHVVSDDTARYSIITNDDTTFSVEVIAKDPVFDIAVLQVVDAEDIDFPFLSFHDSSDLRLGETVIVIGNALAEFRNSVSVGIISGLSRTITARGSEGRIEQLDQVIQTDAAINPGNSGGPMINMRGEVVGMSVATAQGADNISFALPASMVESVVDSIQMHGEIVRPYLGIRYTMITPRIQELNALSVEYGALVSRGDTREELAVMPGSPADKAGIVENDIVLAVDGEALDGIDLATILRKKKVGDVIDLTVLHKGSEKNISVTLEKMP
jgi:serine protease Do